MEYLPGLEQGTRWKVSTAWATKHLDCTVRGITKEGGCGGKCCWNGYWPSVAPDGEQGCAHLGDAGCTLGDHDKPVTCLLYPLRLNKAGTLVLHMTSIVPHGCCAPNYRLGGTVFESLKNNLSALFGPAQYERAAQALAAGKEAWFDVPDHVLAAIDQETAWEENNTVPLPRGGPVHAKAQGLVQLRKKA